MDPVAHSEIICFAAIASIEVMRGLGLGISKSHRSGNESAVIVNYQNVPSFEHQLQDLS